MAKRKIKLAWISQNSLRRSTFRKRRESLLKKISQLSTLCDVKACAIIYDPNEEKAGNPEIWPVEEEAKEILRSFRSMPEMEQSRRMLDREEYLRERVEKLEEQKKKILSSNMETLLTIFLHKCMVGERSVSDLRTVDEAECLMRVIMQKMKAVQDRMKKIEKGKMVVADKAEDGGAGHGSDLKTMVDGGRDMVYGISDDWLDVIEQPCFNADQTVMMGADYNSVGCESNGGGGLEKLIQEPCFDVGEGSSLMGSSSCTFWDDSWFSKF